MGRAPPRLAITPTLTLTLSLTLTLTLTLTCGSRATAGRGTLQTTASRPSPG